MSDILTLDKLLALANKFEEMVPVYRSPLVPEWQLLLIDVDKGQTSPFYTTERRMVLVPDGLAASAMVPDKITLSVFRRLQAEGIAEAAAKQPKVDPATCKHDKGVGPPSLGEPAICIACGAYV